jgi:hypothetical protein
MGLRAARSSKALTSVDEVSSVLRGEIGRCSARTAEQAALLESIAAQTFDLALDNLREASAEELERRSHVIQGIVVHALGVVAELQRVVGKLSALAVLRAAEASSPTSAMPKRRRGTTG